MNNNGSIGVSQSHAPAIGQSSQTEPPKDVKAFTRSVSVVEPKLQKGLRDTVRNFIPLPLYKFVVKLASSRSGQQEKLGHQIAELRKTNKEAWDLLGKSNATGQERHSLQLICQATQLQLDVLEGRRTSPVTIQRAQVVRLLKKAVKEPSPETDQQIKEAFEKLRSVADHEVSLKAELTLQRKKIPALKRLIARAGVINSRLGLESSGLQSKLELSDTAKEYEQQILKDGQKALEQLNAVKKEIRSLKSEIKKFERMLVDEDAAVDAYRSYGRTHKT